MCFLRSVSAIAKMPYLLNVYRLVAENAMMPALDADGFISNVAWLALAYWAFILLIESAMLYGWLTTVLVILYGIFLLFPIFDEINIGTYQALIDMRD